MSTKTEIDMIFTAANEKLRDLALNIGATNPNEYRTAFRIAREFRSWSMRMSGNNEFLDLPENPEDLREDL